MGHSGSQYVRCYQGAGAEVALVAGNRVLRDGSSMKLAQVYRVDQLAAASFCIRREVRKLSCVL